MKTFIKDTNTNETKLSIIGQFKTNQTLSGLQDLKNMGVALKQLKNNNWDHMGKFDFPLSRFVPLYDKDANGTFQITAIGVY